MAKGLSLQAGEGRAGITGRAAVPSADGHNAVNDHNFVISFIFIEKINSISQEGLFLISLVDPRRPFHVHGCPCVFVHVCLSLLAACAEPQVKLVQS